MEMMDATREVCGKKTWGVCSIGSYVSRKTLNLLNGLADSKIFSEI